MIDETLSQVSVRTRSQASLQHILRSTLLVIALLEALVALGARALRLSDLRARHAPELERAEEFLGRRCARGTEGRGAAAGACAPNRGTARYEARVSVPVRLPVARPAAPNREPQSTRRRRTPGTRAHAHSAQRAPPTPPAHQKPPRGPPLTPWQPRTCPRVSASA